MARGTKKENHRRDAKLVQYGPAEMNLLQEAAKNAQAELENALLRMSRYYSRINDLDKAAEFMGRLIRVTEDSEKKAFCLLSLGQLMEQRGDYDAALDDYKRAMLLEPLNDCSWYFIHNNIGCCLNHLELYEEAEQACREAILIDPARYNAFINLGVSLEAQDRFLEAARSFLSALEADADDIELIDHVEELVDEHSEIAAQIQGIREALVMFRQSAEDQQFDSLES